MVENKLKGKSNKKARFDPDKLNNLLESLDELATDLERLDDTMKALDDELAEFHDEVGALNDELGVLNDELAVFHDRTERAIELVTMSPPRFLYNLVTGKIKR